MLYLYKFIYVNIYFCEKQLHANFSEHKIIKIYSDTQKYYIYFSFLDIFFMTFFN